MTKKKSLATAASQIRDVLGILGGSSGQIRNQALLSLAEGLAGNADKLLAANAKDMAEAKKNKLPEALIDRLALNEARVSQLAAGLKETAALPDPLGAVEDFKTLPSGLLVGKLRIPLGLIAFICEARPGAVAEAAAMALKSGNAIIIKPGKEVTRTAQTLGPIISEALSSAGLPGRAVTILPDLSRDEIKELLSLSGFIDLVIPRGGEGLIRFVDENSRVPVLKHFKGVCHLYVDEGADQEMALNIAVNAKAQRPGTCNALECLLVHRSEAPKFLPQAGAALSAQGIKIVSCSESLPYLPEAAKARSDDYGREFLGPKIAVKMVADIDEALDHIRKYGSRHTEAIVTRDQKRARYFLKNADAGCVLVNASTRLNDGGCLGLGAEIGISTTKLHAYGPMGLKELTTAKFVVIGDGHLRK
ncbi:MAG: glutamate-5-semialdehyde dehydrogenase [Deltaproteobacteria bacterium]|jgi:glutamate-5-semialdehyde dehydrogenase|nr:glutamate-5-semialdehyde dehydrogenase [Deltaproteobacteria bacterium]